MATESARLRQEGNNYHSSACQDGIGTSLKSMRFKDAIKCYRQAFSCSSNQDEKVSAAKNIGVVSKKLVNLMTERNESPLDCQYYFDLAVKYLDIAYEFSSCKSIDWASDLLSKFHEIIQDIVSYYTSPGRFEFNEMTVALEGYLQTFEYSHFLRCDLCIEIAQLRFHEGVAKLANKDYKRCLYQMKECYRPIEEARKFGCELEHVMQEVRVLETDVFLHECICRSHQARSEGDSILEKYLKGDERLDMNMVWTVVDLYKEAIILTRENDAECEAIALSRLGSVFDKIVKDKFRAKPYMMRSVQMAMSLHPRTFNADDWFIDARTTLERYQQETVQHEDSAWNKERQPYLDEIKDDLRLINDERSKGYANLLIYIYKTHAPKWKDGLTLPDSLPDTESDNSQWKPIFKNAIVHYHPDKVNVEDHGKKWKVLCEEISKILTCIYERMK